MKKSLKIAFWILIAAGIVSTIIFLPAERWLIGILSWTKGMGMWGPVVAAGLYAVGAVLFLPGSMLTMAAGFLFNVVLGTITVSAGSTIGACAAFWISRTFGRKWVASKIVKSRQFTAFDKAVKRHAFKVILLTRLSPAFPYNMLNYAFGLTRIEFWKYALGSWAAMIPPTIMYTWLGSGLRSLTEIAAGHTQKRPEERIFFWAGMAVTVAATVFIAWLAKKALREELPDDRDEPDKTDRQ